MLQVCNIYFFISIVENKLDEELHAQHKIYFSFGILWLFIVKLKHEMDFWEVSLDAVMIKIFRLPGFDEARKDILVVACWNWLFKVSIDHYKNLMSQQFSCFFDCLVWSWKWNNLLIFKMLLFIFFWNFILNKQFCHLFI